MVVGSWTALVEAKGDLSMRTLNMRSLSEGSLSERRSWTERLVAVKGVLDEGSERMTGSEEEEPDETLG